MGEVKQRVDLDLSGSIAGLEKTANLIQELNSKLDGIQKTSKTAFSNVANVAENYNKSLGDGVKVYAQIDQAAKQHQATVQKLSGNFQSLDNSMKSIGAKGAQNLKSTNTEATKLDKSILQLRIRMQSYQAIVEKATDPRIIQKYNRELQKTEDQIKKLSSQGKKGFDSMGNAVQKSDGMLSKLGGTIAGVFAAGAVLAWAKQIGTAILDVTAEFQKFEAVLTTSLGSRSAAQRAMGMIQEFAAKTPYAINELTDAYVKLAGRGIRASTDQLTKIGDVAAATGKDFGVLTEAILDINNTERWDEVGVKVKTMGDRMTGTFRGVTVEVERTEAGAVKMIEAFGGMEGVAGSMEAVSETITGQMAAMGDAIDKLFLTIGQQEAGGMNTFINFLSEAVGWMTELVATTEQLGKMRAAPFIEDFVANVEPKLKQVAQTAKDTGADMSKALADQTSALKTKLNADLAEAQRVLDEFGPARGWNRDERGDLEANVQKLAGQLNAIADMERQIMEDINRKAAADAAKRAEKAAEEAKKAAAARLKAQQDLNKLFEKMADDADKAKLNLLNKNSEEYLRALRAFEMKQLQELETSIREKQRLAGLSPELNTEQQQQLRILALEIDKKYYDALYKLQEQERDKLLDLQKDSDAKELQILEEKYAREIRAAEEAGQKEVAIALKTARDREKAKLERTQANRNLDQDQEMFRAFAENTLPDGMSEVEKKRALAERLLEIDIEFAEKRLALVANSLEKEDRIKALQLSNEIKRMQDELTAVKESSERFNLQELLGMTDEQYRVTTDAMNTTLNYVQEWTANMVALRQREVESLTRQIDEKGRELDREIALSKDGYASNVATKQAEYDQLKQQREQAMRDQQKAQRQQVLLDSALQISNLVTSSTEIFKVMSPIPFVGTALAIGMIAAMFGAFFAAKSKALQAASVKTYAKGGEGSLINGPSHSQGGIDVVENRTGRRIANIEGGENFYVTNKRSTDKYWPWLEAINANDEKAISKMSLDWLLSGTGVITPNPETPQRLQQLQTEVKVIQVIGGQQETAKQIRELKAISSKLSTIAGNTTPGPEITETETERTIKWGNRTRTIIKPEPPKK